MESACASFYDLAFDKNGDVLAFREERYKPSGGGGIAGSLHLVKPDGGLSRTLPGVCRYAWSPDGKEIALIRGRIVDSGDVGFVPTDLALYDVGKDTVTRVLDYKPESVHWAGFDGCIYFRCEGRSMRWNVHTQAVDEAKHGSIDFSPSGRYYFVSHFGDPDYFDVWVRATDTKCYDREDLPTSAAICRSFGAWRWLDEVVLRVAPRSSDRDDGSGYTLNVENGELRRVDDPIVAVARSVPELTLVIHNRAKDCFELKPLKELELVQGEALKRLTVMASP